MGVRLASFVIWAAVAAGAVFWGLRLGGEPLRAPAHAGLAVAEPPAGGGDLVRLFGAAAPPPAPTPAAAPPPQDNRFKLLGVVAERRAVPSAGLALISLDGQPPRAYGQGASVDGNTVVLAVRHRKVELGPRGGPVLITLELAPPPAAARGSLPGAVGLPSPAGVAMPSVPVSGAMAPRLVPPPPAAVQLPAPVVMGEPGDAGIPVLSPGSPRQSGVNQ